MINEKIVEALGLNYKEQLVFENIAKVRFGQSPSKISKTTHLPRTTVKRILVKLENRKLIFKIWVGKRFYWRYKVGLERFDN